MRNLQLYATGSATGTSVASVTIPAATNLKGVIVSLTLDSITDNGQVRIELSKVPSNQIGTNGALDPFLEVHAFSNFVTSGIDQGSQNYFVPLDVPCRQGEIVYLHATVGGTATYYANFIFMF
jgi:hypothetical protein